MGPAGLAARGKGQHVTVASTPDQAGTVWMIVGFAGQVLFGMRFVVQWIATERAKKSVVPLSFWYLSLAGTIVLLAYAIWRVDPVFIAGFCLNMVIYLRNLYFIHLHPRRAAKVAAEAGQEPPAPDPPGGSRV